MSDQQFEDAESYVGGYSKDVLSFKQIILEHLKKISLLSCVEWRGGYWDTREVYKGNMVSEEKRYTNI